MRDNPKLTGMKEGLVMGAGAAVWLFLDRNAEMLPNFFVKKNRSCLPKKPSVSTFGFNFHTLPPPTLRKHK